MTVTDDQVALVEEEFGIAADIAAQVLQEALAARNTGDRWTYEQQMQRRAELFLAALDEAGISLTRK